MISSVTTPPVSTLLRESRRNGDQVFSQLQRPLLNVQLAKVRMAGVLMTRSGLGGLGVSLGVLAALQSVLTATSQGERLG